MNYIHKYWQQSKVRYAVVGIGVLVVELAIIQVAQWCGLSPVAAVGSAFWVALVLSFSLQKLVAFQDRRVSQRVIGLQLMAYCALVLWNFGFTLLVTAFLQDHVPAVICRIFALAITTVWNYYLYKAHIFRDPVATT